ncbi:MAG: TetR/AcrR family transcriptional regulator [Endozoicomonas sp.]
MSSQNRTQAQRRAETYRQVLDSACRLFGEQGYSSTSLEDIAGDCGLTTRPIYHYFGNKKALFSAVNDVMIQRIIDSLKIDAGDSINTRFGTNWRIFLDLCDDPYFRQIVLIDSPNVLGREIWKKGRVTLRAYAFLTESDTDDASELFRKKLVGRMVIGALTEAALMVAEADDMEVAKAQAIQVVERLLSKIVGR